MKTLLIFLLTTVLIPASTFAAEEKLILFCESPDVSSTLLLNMSLQNDAELALGRYVFQASSDKPNIPSSFSTTKNQHEAYVIANNSKFSIVAKPSSTNQWVALVTMAESDISFQLSCSAD